jgi:hypothetical protein
VKTHIGTKPSTRGVMVLEVDREFFFFDARVIFTNSKRIIRFRRDIWGAYNALRTVEGSQLYNDDARWKICDLKK